MSAFALPVVVLTCVEQRRNANPDFVLAMRGSVHTEHPAWGSRQAWVKADEKVWASKTTHKGLTRGKCDSGQLFCLSSWRKISSAPFTSQDVETLKIISLSLAAGPDGQTAKRFKYTASAMAAALFSAFSLFLHRGSLPERKTCPSLRCTRLSNNLLPSVFLESVCISNLWGSGFTWVLALGPFSCRDYPTLCWKHRRNTERMCVLSRECQE